MPFRITHASGFSELIVLATTADEALDAVYRLLTDESRDAIVITRDGEEIRLEDLTAMALTGAS